MCLWAINKIDVTVSTERFGHNSAKYRFYRASIDPIPALVLMLFFDIFTRY